MRYEDSKKSLQGLHDYSSRPTEKCAYNVVLCRGFVMNTKGDVVQ